MEIWNLMGRMRLYDSGTANALLWPGDGEEDIEDKFFDRSGRFAVSFLFASSSSSREVMANRGIKWWHFNESWVFGELDLFFFE